MKIILFICLNAILILNINSQVVQDWVNRYNGPANDFDDSRDIALDKYGNIFVTGYSRNQQGYYDFLTIKYNPAGVQLWAQRFPANGWAYSIAVDDSGNAVVTGHGYSDSTGQDIVTVKYSNSGAQIWSAVYNGQDSCEDYGWENITDEFCNVYVTGWSFTASGQEDYMTIKYNSTGIQLWAARFNSPENVNDRARSIAIDDSGNVYITGYSGFTQPGGHKGYTVKYNSNGILQWVAETGSIPNVFLYKIALDKFGNVYVNGWDGNSNYEDYLTIKYSPAGVQQWAAVYNGSSNTSDQSRWMILDDTGNVYIGGTSNQYSYQQSFTTIKYNSTGSMQWINHYRSYIQSGISCGWVRGIAFDSLFNVYIIGHGCVPTGGTFDFVTLKYSNSGVHQWTATYNGTGDSSDYGWAIAVDNFNNVYVTGASYGIGSGLDYATIKYSQVIGIKTVNNQIPVKYFLYQNYPNPFNPVTKIRFDISYITIGKPTGVNLTVYDVLGKEITRLVDRALSPGTYEVEWDASNYPSGLYLYRIQSGNFTDSKKMMLIK